MVILREKAGPDKGIDFKEDRLRQTAGLNMNALREGDEGKNISGKAFGFAVDIGTTAVALRGFLFQEDGSEPICLGNKSELNRQVSLGRDVMMRIMHALSGRAEKLQELISSQIEEIVLELLEEWKTEEFILNVEKTRFVIVGNTTMTHLFLGESVEGLKGAPFSPAYTGNRTVSGDDVHFKRLTKAEIFVLSGISAHVGADALAVIGRTSLRNPEKVSLAIDIGTNAEIVLNKRGVLYCCSAAAGPAFEGRGVSCGRLYGSGVITGMKVALHTGNMILEYVPGAEIRGICGSGLIDALAELRKIGILTEDGYLLGREESNSCGIRPAFGSSIMETEKGRAFVLYQTETKIQVSLTQEDIRNLQLAKAAISAAISVLLSEAGVNEAQLDEVILTGVLGSSIRIDNAIRIGLLPDCPKEVFTLAGNAALDGAELLLKEEELRTEWEKLAGEIRHVELAEKEEFQRCFVQAMKF